MSAIRKEILDFIDILSERQLKALKPLLTVLADDDVDDDDVDFIIETDLTEEEHEIIRKGIEDRKNGVKYIPLEEVFREHRQQKAASN